MTQNLTENQPPRKRNGARVKEPQRQHTAPNGAPRRKRQQKNQWSRLLIYALLALLAVLLVMALVSLGKKILRDRQERAEEVALQEERDNSAFFDGGEVLHLSFPVLTLENSEGVPQGSGLTVSEFQTILNDLYERGYVLVDLYSLTEQSEEGYRSTTVMVPEGKMPLVLSQYGVQYSTAQDGRANALTRTSGGDVLASYTNENGETVTGAVDVVPILEAFLKKHPDFSYKGARGILGVTGAQGLFGYQIKKDENILSQFPVEEVGPRKDTAEEEEKSSGVELIGAAVSEEDASSEEEAVPETNSATTEKEGEVAVEGTTESDRILKQNRETIQAILGSLRSSGWHIASNGFGGVSYGSAVDLVKEDAEAWQESVGALVGTTDILLPPGKADIGNWSGYETDDEKVQLLEQLGFRQFCVENNGSLTWLQVRPTYVRQGMHSIDTYATYTSLWDEQ